MASITDISAPNFSTSYHCDTGTGSHEYSSETDDYLVGSQVHTGRVSTCSISTNNDTRICVTPMATITDVSAPNFSTSYHCDTGTGSHEYSSETNDHLVAHQVHTGRAGTRNIGTNNDTRICVTPMVTITDDSTPNFPTPCPRTFDTSTHHYTNELSAPWQMSVNIGTGIGTPSA
ncbi:hypothetical protein C0991_010080, partial [Blastosporella zonata]